MSRKIRTALALGVALTGGLIATAAPVSAAPAASVPPVSAWAQTPTFHGEDGMILTTSLGGGTAFTQAAMNVRSVVVIEQIKVDWHPDGWFGLASARKVRWHQPVARLVVQTPQRQVTCADEVRTVTLATDSSGRTYQAESAWVSPASNPDLCPKSALRTTASTDSTDGRSWA